MKKLYCVIWVKYRKFKNLKKSNIFEKRLVLSIICSKCGTMKNETRNYFLEKNRAKRTDE